MTKILEYANQLAQGQKFPQAVEPVKKWKIPHTKVLLSGLEIISVKKLTLAEKCVINCMRSLYALGFYSHRIAMLTLFDAMGERMGLSTMQDILDTLSDIEKYEPIALERNILDHERQAWYDKLDEIEKEIPLDQFRIKMQNNLCTFFLAMRHDPEWDYEDTTQLSQEEIDSILTFLVEEEGDLPQEDEPNETNVKKL